MQYICMVLDNEMAVLGLMSVLVFLLTNLLKMPIKHFTAKLKDEILRKRFNTFILLIPFVVGVLLDYVYCTLYLHAIPSLLTGISYGTAGIALYNTVSQISAKNGIKIENPYDSKDGKAVEELGKQIVENATINKVVEEKKLAEKDKDAISAFLNKVK